MLDKSNLKAVVLASVLLLASISTVSLADWTPGDGHKMHYPQLPDELGWAVYATAGLDYYGYPQICLADDWRCTESGPVLDIHFWGAWKGNITGIINGFQIAIAADIPASQNPDGYSMPGETLWERTFEVWDPVAIDPPSMEGWYDPYWEEVIYDDHRPYFQYNIVDIPNPFYQEADTIYWLSISAIVAYDPSGLQPLWGWKSSMDHWNDDACWSEWGTPLFWDDLWEPSPPISNQFWIAMDPAGKPDPMHTGGTDYYDDGTGASINGWYYYEDTDWWNIWFYDHPFNDTRIKEIFTSFEIWKYIWELPSWIEVAVNWATDSWEPGGPPPIPPDDQPYIGREIIFTGQDIDGEWFEFFYEILDYNPEWVSIDVRGQNFVIEKGRIEHACLRSLDLAFVITGEEPCTPGIDIEKYVWNETLRDWDELAHIEVGKIAEFLITIHNNGTCCDLTNINIYDFMEDSLYFVGASIDPYEIITVHNGTELYWYFPGPLSPCNWINITVWAEVLGPVCHTDYNYVFVDAECYDTGEWVWDEDYAFVHATEPCTPGIDVEKYVWDDVWVDADTENESVDIHTGTDAEFLITIHNNGTCCDLTDIYVYDSIDASMKFINADPPPDDVIIYPHGTELYWYFPGPLSPCNWINITVTAEIVGEPCSIDENYVYVEGYCLSTDEWAWDSDSAFVHAVEPPQPSIEINKLVWDNDRQAWVEQIYATVGSTVSFKIEIHNNGDYDLTNIVVTDTLPICLDYVAGSAVPPPTNVDGKTITWVFPGPLPYCETITITFDAEVVSEGENINVVTVTANSDEGSVTDIDTATVIVVSTEIPSVEIDKWIWDEYKQEWVKQMGAYVGTFVMFRIDIHNDGDLPLFEIIVTDFLPPCLEYVESIPPPYFFDPPFMVGWFFPGPLWPCETISIELLVFVIFEGPNPNEVCVEAWSDAGPVFDCDVALINAFPQGADIIPPEIVELSLVSSDPIDVLPGFGWENFSAIVTDNVGGIGVDEVKLIVTNPDDTITEYPMTNIVGTDTYYVNTTFTIEGCYSYHVWADDFNDNYAESPSQQFELPANEDVDLDGQIQFMDLVAIVIMYGDEGPLGWCREDVDNDGQAQFMDLVAIVIRYGEWWNQ